MTTLASEKSASILQRLSGLYYGWRMIGLVSALRVLGGGLHQYGFTVFFLPVSRDLGLSRASTSLVFSLARAEGSLLAPLAGYIIDRFGPRPLILAATILAGIGYILFSYVNSFTTFLIVYLCVISLTFTPGFVHAPQVVANSWFIRLRARAMTVVSAAVPVGGAIITPLLAVAVTTFGWRWAAVVAGCMFLLIGIPLSLGVKRSPESMGMEADGLPLQAAQAPADHSAGQASVTDTRETTAREAFRSPIFWNLVFSMTARSAAFTTVTSHFIPMMVWKGQSQTEASVLLAAFAIINLPIHFLLGWIGDFVNKPKLVTICLFLGVVAVLPMLYSDSLWALWFFTSIYCVLDASIPVFWASVGDFFGRRSFGTIRGNMNLFYTWGAVLGPVAAGAVYDRTQSYWPVFAGLAVCLLLSTALTALLIKPWSRTQLGQAQASGNFH